LSFDLALETSPENGIGSSFLDKEASMLETQFGVAGHGIIGLSAISYFL
jgi:hypothetical protein